MFIVSYIILTNLGFELASIYSFVIGMIAIFLLSLYFEVKIRKHWKTL